MASRFFIHDVVVKAVEKNKQSQRVYKAIVSLSKDGSRPVAHLSIEFTETDNDNGRLEEGDFGKMVNDMINHVENLHHP
jgi:hypothetical protein